MNKIPASGLFLKYQEKFFSEISASIYSYREKECIDENEIDCVQIHLQKRPEHDFLSVGWMYRCNSWCPPPLSKSPASKRSVFLELLPLSQILKQSPLPNPINYE